MPWTAAALLTWSWLFMALAVRRVRFTMHRLVARGDAWYARTRIPQRSILLTSAVASSFGGCIAMVIFYMSDTFGMKLATLVATFVFCRIFLFCAALLKKERV